MRLKFNENIYPREVNQGVLSGLSQNQESLLLPMGADQHSPSPKRSSNYQAEFGIHENKKQVFRTVTNVGLDSELPTTEKGLES